LVRKVATRLGKETFSGFLLGKGISMEEIKRRCRLSQGESDRFLHFINRFQLRKLFICSSSSSLPKACRVAYIEKRGKELLILPLDHCDYLSKGKYVINYQRWEKLLEEKRLSPVWVDGITRLLPRLDLVNRRTTTLYQILYRLKEIQRSFFLFARKEDLVPLTQKEIAEQIGISPSSISRTIANKFIITPRGDERLIKPFFGRENLIT